MSKKEEVFEIPENSEDAMDVPVEKVKAPRKKREMSDENKAKMLANLAKGREMKKAKAEAAKAAKEPAKPVEAPKVEPAPVPKETPKKVAKPKEEHKVDVNAERERIALINKMAGKEKVKTTKRAEPALSETTKQTMKSERVKVVDEPKPKEEPKVEAPPPTPKVVAPVAPVAPPKPEVVHIVKRTFNKPIW